MEIQGIKRISHAPRPAKVLAAVECKIYDLKNNFVALFW